MKDLSSYGVLLEENPSNKTIQEKLTTKQYAMWIHLMKSDIIEKMAMKSSLVNAFGGPSDDSLAHFAVLVLTNMPPNVMQHEGR